MKIVLATGIFYPEIGGPAIHVKKIAEALAEKGHNISVISYGDYDGKNNFGFRVKRVSRKLPSFLRWFKYLWLVFAESINADRLYAFNLTTAGIPVFLVGKLFGKKILIRVAGDPIWERIVESGKRFMPISEYYKNGFYLKDRPLVFKAIKFTLPKFDTIVFYTPLLKNLYENYYGVPSDKAHLILNPISKKEFFNTVPTEEMTMLFAGRFVAYKNLDLVIRVFDRLWRKLKRGRLILIGDGPDKKNLEKMIKNLPSAAKISLISKVDQEKLFGYISSSTLGIGPALTEFNPNFILECLSFGKPVLLSRENGLSVKLPEEFLFNAEDEKELEMKMANFFDNHFYQEAIEKVSNLSFIQTWDDVIKNHISFLSNAD